jgi:hypothetical protein
MWRKRQIMIHTDEDDEFERIERESKMKGQPYHWKADAIKAAVLIEREECARLCDDLDDDLPDGLAGWQYGEAIRARSDTSAERVDTNGEHKHDTD